MANALVAVVQSLANALGECQLLVDTISMRIALLPFEVQNPQHFLLHLAENGV